MYMMGSHRRRRAFQLRGWSSRSPPCPSRGRTAQGRVPGRTTLLYGDPLWAPHCFRTTTQPRTNSHLCTIEWKCKWKSRSVVSDSMWPRGLYSPWNSPGQNCGVGTLSLLQVIFPTQGSNPGLPHCRQILYQLSHKGSPRILEWVAYPFSRGSSPGRSRGQILYQLSYGKGRLPVQVCPDCQSLCLTFGI